MSTARDGEAAAKKALLEIIAITKPRQHGYWHYGRGGPYSRRWSCKGCLGWRDSFLKGELRHTPECVYVIAMKRLGRVPFPQGPKP